MTPSQQKFHLGYDIGGTKTEIVLLNSQREVLFQMREATQRDLGYHHILSVLKKLFENAIKEQKIALKDISSIGLALPGTVDPESQKMLIGNTRILEGKNIKEDVLKILGLNVPIHAENDANCFALAECLFGVGKSMSSQSMVGIILGTGVGGGIVLNGKIHPGRRGAAGEIGHTFLLKNEKPCYCGQLDCAELYLCGEGFKNSSLSEYKQNLALFLARLTNILDPDYFVLGGGISKTDALYSDLEKLMIPHLFYKENPPKILKHKLTDSAGSIGAALLGFFDL
jgi:fructokinase